MLVAKVPAGWPTRAVRLRSSSISIPTTLQLDVAQYEADPARVTSIRTTIAALANVVFVQQIVTDSLGTPRRRCRPIRSEFRSSTTARAITRDDGGERPSLCRLLDLDETIGQGENPQADRYNVRRVESTGDCRMAARRYRDDHDHGVDDADAG